MRWKEVQIKNKTGDNQGLLSFLLDDKIFFFLYKNHTHILVYHEGEFLCIIS